MVLVVATQIRDTTVTVKCKKENLLLADGTETKFISADRIHLHIFSFDTPVSPLEVSCFARGENPSRALDVDSS